MKKINFGLFSLLIVMAISIFLYVKIELNFISVMDQLDIINSKLDHLDYDLHELVEK